MSLLVYDQKFDLDKGGSSRPEKFCKKCVLKIFTKFTGKHLYKSLFFNIVAGKADYDWRPLTNITKSFILDDVAVLDLPLGLIQLILQSL